MNPILSYFDLNSHKSPKVVQDNRPSPGDNATSGPQPIDRQPFAAPSSTNRAKSASPSDIPVWQQIIFYLGTVLGVLFSSSVIQFQAGKTPTVSFTLITITLAAIIALVLMPFTYEKAIETDAPFVVQLGIYVQTGVFWSVVFTLIGKAYS